MPTCWNGDLGINNDHISHMAYTVDGSVAGDCPTGFNRRVPQIQLFVRIAPYKGGTYTTSDESNVFHVDFMNGWQDDKLQEIIDNCPIIGNGNGGYNPPCNCDEFMTENENIGDIVCDKDVKNYIIDEEIETISTLPRGTCTGPDIKAKSWAVDPPFYCDDVIVAPTPTPPTPPTPFTPPTPRPTATPTTSPSRLTRPTRPRVTASPSESPPPAPTPTRPTRPRITDFPSQYPSDDEPYYSCADSSLRFKINFNGRRVARDCNWVGNKATRQRCAVDGVAQICAATCETCSECFDSSARFMLNWNNRRIARDCNWVGNKATKQRCNIVGVTEACRETCGHC